MGSVTVYYEGTGGTSYPKSTTAPTSDGSYAVTFDVAAGTNYKAKTSLSAGTLFISVSFSDIELFKTWLAGKPANNAETAYAVKLDLDDSGLSSLVYTLRTDTTKYFRLDLSDSTFTNIYNSFWICSNLTSIILPDSVTSIGEQAFDGCTSLTNIYIPNSVTEIEGNAFNGCTSLTSITLPSGVTSIGNFAFNHCSNLTSINIHANIESIEFGAFFDCTSLTSVTIGSGVTSIGEQAFYGCTSLVSVTFATGSNIPNANFGDIAFPEGSQGNGGNTLKTAYSTGKAGTYTRAANGSTWSKQN
jgi:hypothetical protein